MSLFTTVSNFLGTGGIKKSSSNKSSSNSRINHYASHYPILNNNSINTLGNISMSGPLEVFPKEVNYPDDLRPEMRFFNYELFKRFTPDINGYILGFLIPPPLDGFTSKDNQYIQYFKQLSCFAIMDVTPPKWEFNIVIY